MRRALAVTAWGWVSGWVLGVAMWGLVTKYAVSRNWLVCWLGLGFDSLNPHLGYRETVTYLGHDRALGLEHEL